MALQTSGQISLNDVNVELGNSGTAQIGLGDTDVRDLFGIASGEIEIADGYGASAVTKPSALNYSPLRQKQNSTGKTTTDVPLVKYWDPAGKNVPEGRYFGVYGGAFGDNSLAQFNETDLSNWGLIGTNGMNLNYNGTSLSPWANSSVPANLLRLPYVNSNNQSSIGNNSGVAVELTVHFQYPSGKNNSSSAWQLSMPFFPAKLNLYGSSAPSTPLGTQSNVPESRYGMGWTSSDYKPLLQIKHDSLGSSLEMKMYFYNRTSTYGYSSFWSDCGDRGNKITFPSATGLAILDWVSISGGSVTISPAGTGINAGVNYFVNNNGTLSASSGSNTTSGIDLA